MAPLLPALVPPPSSLSFPSPVLGQGAGPWPRSEAARAPGLSVGRALRAAGPWAPPRRLCCSFMGASPQHACAWGRAVGRGAEGGKGGGVPAQSRSPPRLQPHSFRDSGTGTRLRRRRADLAFALRAWLWGPEASECARSDVTQPSCCPPEPASCLPPSLLLPCRPRKGAGPTCSPRGVLLPCVRQPPCETQDGLPGALPLDVGRRARGAVWGAVCVLSPLGALG